MSSCPLRTCQVRPASRARDSSRTAWHFARKPKISPKAAEQIPGRCHSPLPKPVRRVSLPWHLTLADFFGQAPPKNLCKNIVPNSGLRLYCWKWWGNRFSSLRRRSAAGCIQSSLLQKGGWSGGDSPCAILMPGGWALQEADGLLRLRKSWPRSQRFPFAGRSCPPEQMGCRTLETAQPGPPWHTFAATGCDYSAGGHLPNKILEITRGLCHASCSEVADWCLGVQTQMGQCWSQTRWNLCPRCA